MLGEKAHDSVCKKITVNEKFIEIIADISFCTH